jgi:prophage antirepressor-like protein
MTSKKVLYLTYLGLIRVLFVSKNPNCEQFQKWVATSSIKVDNS